jgi:tetratricopeptide (TPR) repeat protein
MITEPRRLDFSPYLRREPITLALLTGMAIVFFLAVSALSNMHDAQRESLAERWAGRGVADLKARQYQPAVVDFRTALLYTRDSSAYELSLAQALMGLGRDDEAHAYLINLWEREPDNGLVSLELARIAANKGQTEQALRYYHNAIYATWTGDHDAARHQARLELINYLLRINAQPQADAELIDLSASYGRDVQEQLLLGQLFQRSGDASRALAAFQAALKLDRHNATALAGAGSSAYELARYLQAQRYLEDAHEADPGNAEVSQQLKMAQTVLHWDPFLPQVPLAVRNRMALDAFAASGDRLKTCVPATPAEQTLQQTWTKLQPQMHTWTLRRQPDLVDDAMNLAFEIEKQTAGKCGPPSDADRALLLVSSLHEEN